MRIGAYQFAVTGVIENNLAAVQRAVSQANDRGVELLIFPECALTGYPPHTIKDPSSVDFQKLSHALNQLQETCDSNNMHIITGSVTRENERFYNSAILFAPDKEMQTYHKQALWGWDKDNFTIGNKDGIFEINGWKIGVRICFEIRFPEFFRELYKADTDLNIVLFYDTSDEKNAERYEMIRSHIITRAVENVTYTLSVNAVCPHQTAPTMLCDRSGDVLGECSPDTESMLIYDLDLDELTFGQQGRKEVSDWLLRGR